MANMKASELVSTSLKDKKQSSANNKQIKHHQQNPTLMGYKSGTRSLQKLNKYAQHSLNENKILLPENEGFIETEGLEKTYKFSQADLLSQLDYGLSKKMFDINLSYGPYKVDISRNGNHFLIGGVRGSLSLINFNSYSLLTELNVKETVRDMKFLQDHTLFAAAQKKHTFIYDNNGIEIHCLKDLMMSYCLDYLPYHYLLTSIGEFGELSYTDISTGQIAARHKTHRGPCHTMRQNPQSAVMNLGHSRGTVSLWTPNLSKAAAEILCHKGQVVALDSYDHYLATSGIDGFWKIWDIRNFKCLRAFTYFGTPPSSLRLSQSGVVALGFGPHLQLWKDSLTSKPSMPYLTQNFNGSEITSLSFRPFEDICLVGRNDGVNTTIVPGSALANFDNLEENPYESLTQRREKQVRRLIEKIPSDMITLKPREIFRSASELEFSNINNITPQKEIKSKKLKNKMRGKGSSDKMKQAFNKVKASKIREANRKRIQSKKETSKSKAGTKSLGSINYEPLQRFSK